MLKLTMGIRSHQQPASPRRLTLAGLPALASLLFGCITTASGADPTTPGASATARLGMRIERWSTAAGQPALETSGARLVFERDGGVRAAARIPAERDLLEFSFEPKGAWTLERADRDEAHLSSAGATLEIHGDSVMILRTTTAGRLTAIGRFRPEWHAAKDGRHLLLDETGGFGVYPVRPTPAQAHGLLPLQDGGLAGGAVGAELTWSLAWELAEDDEVWLGVFPPRPADPRRLLQSIAHEGAAEPFPKAAYPSSEIVATSAHDNQIFALHAYFWKEAPDAFKPTTGKYVGRRCAWLSPKAEPAVPALFERLRRDVKAAGMQLVVYLSPFYSNAPDFRAEMERVLKSYDVDGFYFDGTRDDFREAYHSLRSAREVLGDDRILYVHCSTLPFRSAALHAPFIDAYADFTLRGEAGRGEQELDPFLRWIVSGWNSSNAVGVWCHYGSTGQSGYVSLVPPPEHIAAALRQHVRIWRRSGWSAGGRPEDFDQAYYPALKRLQEQELRTLRGRTGR